MMSGNLVVDTGATNTVVARRLANLLGIQPASRAVANTVGGPVVAGIVRLDSVKVDTAEVDDLSTLVQDFSSHPHVERLLGTDLFSRFQVGFDSPKHLIGLSAR